MFRQSILIPALLVAVSVPVMSLAQDAPRPREGQEQNQNNDRNRRGNWDPAQMRERMLGMVREQVGANDDEWQVLSPKIEAVMTSMRDARAGGMGGGRRGGGPGGAPDEQPQSAVSNASRDLRTALENQDTNAETINAKLAALREARAKAQQDLTSAQKDLKELLTARQEAVLVSMGMLD